MLQAVAVHISLLALTFTDCNIYLPPSVPIDKADFNLFHTTPSPYGQIETCKYILWSLWHGT